MARKPHLRYRNTHSSAKRVFQSSASPFGTGVKPCLHIRPAALRSLISQYTLLQKLYQLKQVAVQLQCTVFSCHSRGVCRASKSKIHAILYPGCTTPYRTYKGRLLQRCVLRVWERGAQCRETASSAPPFSVRTERGPLGTVLASSFSIARARKSFMGSQAGPGESIGAGVLKLTGTAGVVK